MRRNREIRSGGSVAVAFGPTRRPTPHWLTELREQLGRLKRERPKQRAIRCPFLGAAGGLDRAPERAANLGCETMQIIPCH